MERQPQKFFLQKSSYNIKKTQKQGRMSIFSILFRCAIRHYFICSCSNFSYYSDFVKYPTQIEYFLNSSFQTTYSLGKLATRKLREKEEKNRVQVGKQFYTKKFSCHCAFKKIANILLLQNYDYTCCLDQHKKEKMARRSR